jgi:hypothetical protein
MRSVDEVLKQSLEPGAQDTVLSTSDEIQLSQAISLKRLADSMEKLAESVNTPDEYGLTGSAALSNRLRQLFNEISSM